MTKYGYVRVSSREQNPERQIIAMKEYGVLEKNIYMDKMSGKDFNRPAYKRLLRRAKAGDLIVIKSIDRLGRNYTEIIEEWRHISDEKGIDIHVIDMQLLNTNVAHGDLTGKLIADMVLQILAYVAETERTFIKQRQEEGIAIARKNGVHFGATKKELPEEFDLYYEKWLEGEITIREAAEKLGVSSSLFYRRSMERKNEMEMKS